MPVARRTHIVLRNESVVLASCSKTSSALHQNPYAFDRPFTQTSPQRVMASPLSIILPWPELLINGSRYKGVFSDPLDCSIGYTEP